MGDAQRAALMAIFAAMEERGEDEEGREPQAGEVREGAEQRPIEVDLAVLALMRLKSSV